MQSENGPFGDVLGLIRLAAIQAQLGHSRRCAAAIDEGDSLSDHAHPLRSVDANRVSGATSQIECNTARKWATIINHHGN